MFEHIFAEMNSALDDIARRYPEAEGEQKEALGMKWKLLKQMSDGIIEEWMSFEEKMGEIRRKCGDFEAQDQLKIVELGGGPFLKGQGYFTLKMYKQASEHFEQASSLYPDNPLPLLFLAVCRVHLNDRENAAGYLNYIFTHGKDKKLKAICCNALGCLAAMDNRVEKARGFFLTAYKLDPSLPEPLANLEACMENRGTYQFESQLHAYL
ncbi:hypothetical protein AWM70_09670 [Paenibacillus yonginensis]|uniref:Uncharacterized protein n=1 Tax=Paenibacillus yonginensis TaxID=1462996 RepID=A0A1B1N091_9BACL|nr:hypothetical protein [Paenibacillus yonginensis]ANS74828.1 hypothetical protein AWM70_09670 [Paenibacillus yonginensis]